jgi:hypothetical protein
MQILLQAPEDRFASGLKGQYIDTTVLQIEGG